MQSTSSSPENDLTLIVGPTKVPLRVNRTGMRLASPVFNSMLGGSFKEGRSDEVALPETDPEALALIIGFTKFEGLDTMPSSADVLREVAILADYYNFAAAKYALKHWFSTYGSSLDAFGLWPLVQAAFVISDAQAFNTLSARLMIVYAGSFTNLEPPYEQVPQNLHVLLAEKRSALWGHLLEKFWKHQEVIFGPANGGIRHGRCDCGFLPAFRAKCVDQIARIGAMTRVIRGGTINGDMNSMSSLIVDDPQFDSCRNTLCHDEAKNDLRMRLKELSRQINTYGGLCLDCLKGRPSCQLAHL